jgi:hypothetical protein
MGLRYPRLNLLPALVLKASFLDLELGAPQQLPSDLDRAMPNKRFNRTPESFGAETSGKLGRGAG